MFLCDLVDRREIVHSAKALPTCLNVHFLQQQQQLFSLEREMYELEQSLMLLLQPQPKNHQGGDEEESFLRTLHGMHSYRKCMNQAVE